MKTIIFGCGYIGKLLLNLFPDASTTELPDLCSKNQIPFDFTDKESWNNIPEFDQAIITFKMEDSDLAESFAKLFFGKKTIVLSSARNFANSLPDETISEEYILKDIPRARAEKHFSGISTILYLGLIWGKERSPKKWIAQGRIKNGSKYINFINAGDLCKIIHIIMNRPDKPISLLVSDGKPIKWSDVSASFGQTLEEKNTGLESRKFNTQKLMSILPKDFKFSCPIDF